MAHATHCQCLSTERMNLSIFQLIFFNFKGGGTRVRPPLMRQWFVIPFTAWSDSTVGDARRQIFRALWLIPRLHDTTGCQTGCSTGWTTGLTTGWMFVYTMQPVVQPVVQPVWQPVVSCKRGFSNFWDAVATSRDVVAGTSKAQLAGGPGIRIPSHGDSSIIHIKFLS